MRWRAGLAAAGALALVGAALGARQGPSGPSLEELNMAVTYVFSPVRPCPGYETGLLVLRSDRKLRPLFVTGRGKGTTGRLTLALRGLAGLGSIADDRALGRLLDFGKTEGEFTIGFARYSHDRVDTARTVATEWLERAERPEILLHVKKLTDFGALKDRKGDRVPGGYQVTLHGALEVGGRRVDLKAPADCTLTEASPSRGVKASMGLKADLVLRGADLGLAGEDAGEIRAAIHVRGFTDYRAEAESLLKEAELPSLD